MSHFGASDQNIFTEWHSRYGDGGVLIYWHVERKSRLLLCQLWPRRADVVVEAAISHVVQCGHVADLDSLHEHAQHLSWRVLVAVTRPQVRRRFSRGPYVPGLASGAGVQVRDGLNPAGDVFLRYSHDGKYEAGYTGNHPPH